MKEAIIYLLFDNWCNSGHEPEVIEAMKKLFRILQKIQFLNFLLQ